MQPTSAHLSARAQPLGAVSGSLAAGGVYQVFHVISLHLLCPYVLVLHGRRGAR